MVKQIHERWGKGGRRRLQNSFTFLHHRTYVPIHIYSSVNGRILLSMHVQLKQHCFFLYISADGMRNVE